MNGNRYQFKLKRGDVFTIPDLSVSFKGKIVGIDRYTEATAAGGTNTWVSYTAEGQGAPKGSRWERFWLVDGQAEKTSGIPLVLRSFYVAATSDKPPEGYVLDRELSGRVELRSEGDASRSSGAKAVRGKSTGRGALFTYSNEKGDLWAEEVFENSPRLVFESIFEKPGQEI